MIHEYALEPGLVATWVDKPTAALIRQSFGVGRGRLISRFPKAWAKQVYGELKGATPIEKKMVDEILALLTEKNCHAESGALRFRKGGLARERLGRTRGAPLPRDPCPYQSRSTIRRLDSGRLLRWARALERRSWPLRTEKSHLPYPKRWRPSSESVLRLSLSTLTSAQTESAIRTLLPPISARRCGTGREDRPS